MATQTSVAKTIGIVALVIVVLVGFGLGWMWRRVTALPDWYESGAMIAEDGRPQVDQDWVVIPEAEGPADAPPGAEVYQLRNPHLRQSTTGSREKARPINDTIKQSRATYSGGKVDAGAVVNLSEIKLDKLSPKEREQYEDTIEAFPALTGRDVYVGIEGATKDGDGKLALGPNTKLRVGDTRYSLRTAAKRLGVSEAELRRTIEKELGGMNLELPKD